MVVACAIAAAMTVVVLSLRPAADVENSPVAAAEAVAVR